MALRAGADASTSPCVRPADAVDVRLVDLAAGKDTVAEAETILTSEEVARARRGAPAVHRRRILLRAALRRALGAELGTDPAAVPLRTTPAGRPHLAPAAAGPVLDFSCSASGSLGLVALGRSVRLGVDVEAVVAWSPVVLDEGWLAPAEQSAITALLSPDRAVAAARAWTRKEAVLKARGCGLRTHPASVVTSIGTASELGGPETVAGWEVHDVPVPHGWVASLALRPLEELPA